jgi:hypothetical protein
LLAQLVPKSRTGRKTFAIEEVASYFYQVGDIADLQISDGQVCVIQNVATSHLVCTTGGNEDRIARTLVDSEGMDIVFLCQ